MGLLDLVLGADNPVSQFANRNSNLLTGLGTSLLSSGMNFAPAQRGSAMDYEVAQQAKEEAKQATAQNQTLNWLKTAYPQYSNLPPAEGFKLAFEAEQAKYQGLGAGGGMPANVREWEYFNKLAPEDQSAYLRMKRANPYLDIGTGFVQPDPINPGQTSGGPIVKDNFTPAYDSASGGAQAKVDVETQAAADSLASKLPGLKSVIGELSQLANTATYTQTGQLIDTIARETGAVPGEAAVARTKYIAMVDNQVLPLLRDTFGAAFTVKEGETLRATLGDPNKAPAEKQAILEAFIEQKTRDLAALQSRLPGAGGGGDDVEAILQGMGL